MNREPNFDGQDIGGGSTSDAFDLIVAGWRAEGGVPEWPATGQQPGIPEPAAPADPGSADRAAADPAPVDPAKVEALEPQRPEVIRPATSAPEDEHFVPPEPPPLPRIGPPALVGAVLLAVGLVLVLTPGWFGLSDIYGLPLGLIALAAGLGWLVLRLWPDSLSAPDRDEGDDGAVL